VSPLAWPISPSASTRSVSFAVTIFLTSPFQVLTPSLILLIYRSVNLPPFSLYSPLSHLPLSLSLSIYINSRVVGLVLLRQFMSNCRFSTCSHIEGFICVVSKVLSSRVAYLLVNPDRLQYQFQYGYRFFSGCIWARIVCPCIASGGTYLKYDNLLSSFRINNISYFLGNEKEWKFYLIWESSDCKFAC
jgi:hypothetical protein